MQKQIIRIIGISGAGKTTLGNILAKELGYTYIELDDFYLSNKPKVRLSNHAVVSNWDILDAIDIASLQSKIKLTEGNIIIGGFALIDKIFPIEPNFTICLEAGKSKEEIILRTIEARKRSKGFIGDKEERDKLMVNEVVYPYYLRMLQETTVNAYLCTYENNERIGIDKLIQIILNYIRD
jgi:thymidylate kinase